MGRSDVPLQGTYSTLDMVDMVTCTDRILTQEEGRLAYISSNTRNFYTVCIEIYKFPELFEGIEVGTTTITSARVTSQMERRAFTDVPVTSSCAMSFLNDRKHARLHHPRSSTVACRRRLHRSRKSSSRKSDPAHPILVRPRSYTVAWQHLHLEDLQRFKFATSDRERQAQDHLE